MKRFSPAKINLGLAITGVLPGGYHSLHSVFARLDVGDELEFHPAAQLTLEVYGADLPTDQGNLVYRAAELYLQQAGITSGVQIVLHKRLPLASGLGGGSSNAATTLLALQNLFHTQQDLYALAKRLGADVPFFLLGHHAVVTGFGEILTPVALSPVYVVLCNPHVAVSAKDAYAWWDASNDGTLRLNVPDIQQNLAEQKPLLYHNSLQQPVLAHHPEIAEVLNALQQAGLHSPLMSGSGSTCFGLSYQEHNARDAATQLQQRFPEYWIQVAQLWDGVSEIRS